MRNLPVVGICLGRHLGLRILLLLNINKTSRTPHCVPQNQLWWQNHIFLTQCCLAHRDGSMCNHQSDECCSTKHNSHRWSGSHSTNLRHNENTLQEKHPRSVSAFDMMDHEILLQILEQNLCFCGKALQCFKMI